MTSTTCEFCGTGDFTTTTINYYQSHANHVPYCVISLAYNIIMECCEWESQSFDVHINSNNNNTNIGSKNKIGFIEICIVYSLYGNCIDANVNTIGYGRLSV